MIYKVRPIVCDYAVYPVGSKEITCICNCKINADLIADILNADQGSDVAYGYIGYSNAKWKLQKLPDEFDLEDFRSYYEES